MDKKLSHEEILVIIKKLNKQYDEYSMEYGESFFSKKEFKKRYMEALKKKMDLQAFAFAEIAFLEDLKEKLGKKQEERRIKTEKPFTKKIEKYIEEIEDKWQKYPQLFSSSSISEEAQFFCGAVNQFYNELWLQMGKLIKKDLLSELKDYNALSYIIEKFIMATKNRFPYEVESYLFNLDRHGIEKANMLFLKEGADLLRKIKKFLTKITEKMVKESGNSEIEDKTLLKTIDYIEQIITDFRFSNLI